MRGPVRRLLYVALNVGAGTSTCRSFSVGLGLALSDDEVSVMRLTHLENINTGRMILIVYSLISGLRRKAISQFLAPYELLMNAAAYSNLQRKGFRRAPRVDLLVIKNAILAQASAKFVIRDNENVLPFENQSTRAIW